MVKVPLKWFSLLLCAGVMITSSDLQAQRKKTSKAMQKKNDSKKEADEEKPKEEEELVVEEITDEQFDTDEEAEGGQEGKEEAEEKEPAKEAEAEEEAEEPAEEKAEKKPAELAVIGSEEPAAQEEKPEEAAEEPATEEAAAEEEKPADEVAEPEEAVAETEALAEEGEPPAEGAEEPAEALAKTEEPEPKEELGPDEIMGIDTVDLEDPQGNWLYKRVWWERAEAKYEKIRAAVTSVLEIRTKFFAKRAELDKNTLDPFYIKIGFSQGELKERLTERIAQLEKDIEDKSDAQRLEKLEANKLTLEDLQKEVAIVVKQDEEVENAIMMLVEQANKMRNYEQQAWQDFKNIARVLDDKKARELFYKVDGAWRNIQELKQYVENNFSTGFDQLVQRVVQQVQKVDAAMQQLKEKGLDLKRTEEDADEDEDEAEEPPRGIISRFIITPISTVFRAIWDVIMWPIRKIMGTTTSPVSADESEEVVAKTEAPLGKPVEEEIVQEEITEEVAVEEPKPVDKKELVSGEPEEGAPESEPTPVEGEESEPTESIPTPSVTVPASMPTPPDVPDPEPAGMPLAEGDVASISVDESEKEAEDDVEPAMAAPEGDEPGGQEVVEEETIEVDEGEPMMDDLDTSLEIEEE